MIEGEIISLAFGGSGILREKSGRAIFVPFTAPGDLVQVELTQEKKSFAIGKCLAIIKPSDQRAEPVCPYFEKCGGCDFQHLKIEAQRAAKEQFIKDAAKRIGHFEARLHPLVPSPESTLYRKQITLKLNPKEGGFTGVFTGVNPNEKIAINSCSIFSEDKVLFEQIHHLLAHLPNSGVEDGSLKIVKGTEGKFIALFSFYPKIPIEQKIAQELLAVIPLFQGIYLAAPGSVIEVGTCKLALTVGNLEFAYKPTCFTQNNPEMSLQIYQKILQLFPTDGLPLLDLYCGIGITTLLLAQQGHKTVGVEMNRSAISYANQNALQNKIVKASFVHAPVEKFLATNKIKEKTHLLINPPREGLSKEAMTRIKKIPFKTLVYLSCNPSTLARDLALLKELPGFKIVSLQPYDLFPQTTHIETIAHCQLE